MWEFWFSALALANVAVWIGLARRQRRRLADLREETRELLEKDEKIFRLYREIEGMLDSFEGYVGEVQREMELRRAEALEMSRQATALYMQSMQPGAYARPAPPPDPVPAPADPPAARPPAAKTASEYAGRLSARERQELARLSSKQAKVRFLMGKGLTIAEAAREMGIGKGEVKLIVDLDKG